MNSSTYKSAPAPERLEASDLRVAIAVTRWNASITTGLLAGALETLNEVGVPEVSVSTFWCSGAFELPLVVKTLSESGRFDITIALGAVIRGDTPHFDFVARAASDGLARAAYETDVPCGFGLLTLDTAEQGEIRARPGKENKGREAVLAAVDTILLLREIEQGTR